MADEHLGPEWDGVDTSMVDTPAMNKLSAAFTAFEKGLTPEMFKPRWQTMLKGPLRIFTPLFKGLSFILPPLRALGAQKFALKLFKEHEIPAEQMQSFWTEVQNIMENKAAGGTPMHYSNAPKQAYQQQPVAQKAQEAASYQRSPEAPKQRNALASTATAVANAAAAVIKKTGEALEQDSAAKKLGPACMA
jgi:hypothetical protein